MFKKKKSKSQDHKFCPVCGIKLKLTDTFCVKCGYSFAARVEKSKKLKKRNLIIILVLLIVAYFGLRYANGQTPFPTSFADALRTIIPIK
ncbi:zinc ribbon domain-containing protein [Candidatus Pacearchaeota archaeon]|nr:zinc ribbon domain-containing protein [Candidatus Pacearchaeota archaeon]